MKTKFNDIMKRLVSKQWMACAALFVLHFSLFVSRIAAQEVTVTVTPVQQVLPPQALLYMADPGKYFNITLINNSAIVQNVYLNINLEQTMPAEGISIHSPSRRQPQTPFSLAPGQVRQLTLVEMKNLFNHIPKNEIQTSPGLFDNFENGAFGLLPEGQYRAQVTAYKWDLAQANPVALSDPTAGFCNFTICYKAQSPEFLTPVMGNGGGLVDLSVAEMMTNNAQFTWRQPVVACNPAATQFTYEFKIVELLPAQQPDDAIERNAAVYIVRDLVTPMVIVPPTYVNKLSKDKTYVAQVKAKQTGTGANMLNYVMLENEGKSPFRMFKVKEPINEMAQNPLGQEEDKKGNKDDKKDDNKDDKQDKPVNDEDDTSGYGVSGKSDETLLDFDSLYVFKNPTISQPTFEEGVGRKLFLEDAMEIAWQGATYVGGDGQRQDTLTFDYNVELYRATIGCDKDSLFKTKPLFSKAIKSDDKVTNLTLEWEELSKLEIQEGDYMVLRVNPKCTNETNIRFQAGSNVVDFAMTERLSKKYFQCSSTVDITNNTPTKKSDEDLKGSIVAIGEYNLTLDEIKSVKGTPNTYEGKGHVEWNPMGFKVMVAVKFNDLKINTEDQVYAGSAVSYQEEEEKQLSDGEIVDKLFSDWGIDNLIGDTSIPYSQEIQQATTSGIKNLAEKLDISKYYAYVKKGEAIYDAFLTGEIKDLHLPLQLPKSINKTPVDIQIVSMKFGHNYATMNVMGEFTLPDSKYYDNDILLLGAPRLCISPNRVLPESGTIALLGNFTVNDPQSNFKITFKAPDNVLEPNNGCFISWHADALELFDIDVDMKIPNLVKVDAKGNRTNEMPTLSFHASVGDWEDWFAEGGMDMFEPEDLEDWSFLPGSVIVYDHSKHRNAPKMGQLPQGYDKVKAGFPSAASEDVAWQGLYVKEMSVIFPKMLSLSDKAGEKNFEGRLKLQAKDMFFDASGASFQFGMNNVFSFETGKVGGWGISMDEVKLDVMQNNFQKCYFNGIIKTPLEGNIGYRCDIYAQGKDENGKKDPNRSAYIFKTQQVDGLKFDFWLGEMNFDHDQTYFLVEAEKKAGQEIETKVELCMGGDMTITVGRDQLKKLGKVGSFVDSKIPGININGMRIANCERWKSHYTQNQYESPTGGGELNDFFGWKDEYNIKDDNFYFSLGRWSLSTSANEKVAYAARRQNEDAWLLAQNAEDHGPAPEMQHIDAIQAGKAIASGKLGCFEFSLTDVNFNYSGKKATLSVGGKVSVMDGQLTAGCGLDLTANVDLDNYSFSFGEVKFKKAEFTSEFGGVSVHGELEAGGGNDDGYSGELSFALPGGFLEMKANGGWFKRTSGNDKYTWGYFLVTAKSEAGLRFDPIVITKLTGGFYFNCKAPKVVGDKPTSNDAEKGIYGGVLGVGLATSGGENMLTADMDLTVVYDANRKKLSSIIMNGTLDALKPNANDKGMVNAKCQLAYVNDDKQKYIEINITASGGASLDKSMQEKFKALTGKAFAEGKALQKGLSDLTKEETENKSTEAKKDQSNDTFKAKCGFEVSVNFKVTLTDKKDEKAKWHLYIGEPDYEKRCRLTLIDFQLGKKSDLFAAWAYLGANMYLCIGNELPNNGALPDPPQAVLDFLNGKDVNGGNQDKGKEAKSAKKSAIDKMKNIINSAEKSGGLMVGAGAEGDFGINAGIVYASGSFAFGFDLVLEHFGEGAKCQGGKSMGYHGWYGMGQAYAMLKGDLGVRIKLWFIDKKVSLISVGLGAMLQAGLPNPTWVYGKVRARCSLLGGLFKFNHSIEFKAGDVCMPDYGNPLDNLKMFSSASIGYENDQEKGWDPANKVSVYSEPKFVTNYVMDTSVRLVDENKAQDQIQNKGANETEARANCERIYKFILGNLELYNQDTGKKKIFTASSNNNTDYWCNVGTLQPDTRYKMTLRGYAKEYFTSKKAGESKWDNPEIDGKRQEKKDEVVYYFRTGPLEPTIDNDIALAIPESGGFTAAVRREDAILPQISLKRHRDDLSKSNKYDIKWEVWKGERRLLQCDNVVWTGSNKQYEVWSPFYNLGNQIPEGVKGGAYTGSWEGDWGYGYRLMLVRIEKKNKELVMSQKQTKTNKSTKQADSKSKSAIGVKQPNNAAQSSAAAKMNEFFQNQEKEEQNNRSTLEEESNKMTAEAKKDDGRYILWETAFNETVNSNFKNEQGFYNEHHHHMKGTYIAVHDFETTRPYFFSWALTDESNSFLGALTENQSLHNYSNLKTYINNPYYLATFYSAYLGLGGRTLNKFKLYDYEENKIPGFEFTFSRGVLRRSISLDGILSINSSSTRFYNDFFKLIPLRRRDGYYFTRSNKGKEAGYTGVLVQTYSKDGMENAAPDGFNTGHGNGTSLVESEYFNYAIGAAMVGDAITMDLFSNDLKSASRWLYRLMYNETIYRINNNLDLITGEPIYYTDKKGKTVRATYTKDNAKNFAEYKLKNIWKTYMNTISTDQNGKQYFSYTRNKTYLYSYMGSYKLPYRQVMLALWMSKDLGKVYDREFYGDPVKEFNKNNFTHRYNHMKQAWNTMYYDNYDANELLKNWKSLTFVKYMPDAYNIDTGEFDVILDRHKNEYKFPLNAPFQGFKVTRTTLKNR